MDIRISPWTRSVLAGSVSGMASVVVCHPFDTIRTRLQTSPSRFRGFVHCASRTIRQESVAGLYKGFLPPFFSQAVYKSVIFTTSSALRTDVLPTMPFYSHLTPSSVSLIGGAIAGAVNSFLVTPVELVRNRLQVQFDETNASRKYGGAIDCLAKVVKTEGVLSLWRGVITTILRDSLGVACYFLGYESAKAHLGSTEAFGDTSVLLLSGAAGGISFWSIALPFDTIKSLIQVETDAKARGGTIQTASRLVRQHGVSHLFRGWQAAFSRGVPGAAITFWTFETSTRYLSQYEKSTSSA